MNNNIAIKVENLTKVYKLYNAPIDRMKEALHPRKKSYHKEFYALNDVSFEIKKGETVGIIGKNGSGKSTLLKIITGVLTPTSGSVTVNGRVSALLELGAGFNPEYTGMENIYFQGNIMGFSREEMDTKIQDIVEFADIGDFIYQPVKNYSSGMFARLAFAVAINVEPDILIVDEALSVGDAKFQNKCMSKIKNMKDCGLTILFVSHATTQITAICSSAIWLNHGILKAIGLAQDVTSLYIFDQSKEERNNIKTRGNELKLLTDVNSQEHFLLRHDIVEIMKDSKDVVLLGYKLVNEFGSVVSTIDKYGVYQLEIFYQIHNDLFMPFFVFIIENTIGESLIKFNSIQLGSDLGIFRNASSVKLRIKFTLPDLATGDYFIKTSLHCGEIYNNQPILNIKLFHFEYTRKYEQSGYISTEAYIYNESL
jgi:ABC-type polysaccharide/polyol phosphate transport system ATPase subunit